MRVARVILDVPAKALDSPYSYALPLQDPYRVRVGCACVVPFGNREVIGFVIGFDEVETTDDVQDLAAEPAVRIDGAKRTLKLKRIKDVVSEPFFDAGGAACAQFISSRYLAPLSSCIRLFTPPGSIPKIVKKDGEYRVVSPSVGAVDDRWVVRGSAFGTYEPKRNAVKQIAILKAVEQGDVRMSELTAEYGSVAAACKALAAMDVIQIVQRRRYRDPSLPVAPSTADHVLTEGQAKAVKLIGDAFKDASGQVVLVDGITGSGKTEVYLRAIQEVLAAGKTACVLVPEISLTPQTVARFRGRFGDTVAVMHSRMGQGERYDQWDFIRSGAAKVVVGARSALFTPMKNLGIIVIDEEHESSYKQDSAPRYVTRDVAAWIAKRNGAVLVLGSATPSLTSLYACKNDPSWHYVTLPQRATGATLPDITVVDMAKEFHAGSRSMFSEPLTHALERELAAGHKAVMLLNQRGFARFLLCRDCGFVPECPSCSTSLTFHERGHKLVCHHCGYQVPEPPSCPACGSPYLRKFGTGTQRVEDDLAALVATFDGPASQTKIIRMDADTTKGKGAHQRLLEEFASADRAVLLGTQMIAKGLDFEDVTLVGVINADTMLKLPDYRAAERTFDLIQQVAGRAGRASLPGEVYVQTYQADAVCIQAAAAYDRKRFLDDELRKRRLLGYPPYVRLANVLAWGKDEAVVADAARSLYAEIKPMLPDGEASGWEILPAAPCVLSKLNGSYWWHCIVKAPAGEDIAARLEPVFRRRKANPAVNITVDVDPDGLL